MKSLKKQRRIQIIALTFLALAGATALIGYGTQKGIRYYRSPTEVIAERPSTEEVFKLGGMVVVGSIKQDNGTEFEFSVTDGNITIPIRYVGTKAKPDLFEEGQATIATGRYVDGVFYSTLLLAKHDESYMPKEVMDSLKEQGVYQAPNN